MARLTNFGVQETGRGFLGCFKDVKSDGAHVCSLQLERLSLFTAMSIICGKHRHTVHTIYLPHNIIDGQTDKHTNRPI
jgi:hypothetical protein